jgi:hypothetical protein
MRRLCVFTLFVLSSAAWGAEGPSFHFRSPVVGARATLTSGSVMEITFQGATTKVTRMLSPQVYEAKILEVSDKAVTKARLHYHVDEESSETEGKLKRKVKPLAGKFREIHARRDGTPEGLFGFHVKAAMPTDDGLQIEMSSSGTMAVALEPCRLLSMEMAGSVAISGTVDANGKKVPVQGLGTAKVNVLAQYQ